MKQQVVLLTLSCWFFTRVTHSDGKGYCSFPTFLLNADGSQKKWIGRTEYSHHSKTWNSQQEIIISDTELIIRNKIQVPCDASQQRMGQYCFSLESVEEVMCLAEEAGGKYRVQLKSSQNSSFTCMTFQQKSEEVMQVYQAAAKSVNEDRLCHDKNLHRLDWPWLGSNRVAMWQECPLVGGFDFGLYFRDTIERECSDIWRPSRMESECIKGESLNFYFPEIKCSPFHDQRLSYRFNCFASWSEDQYIFILFGQLNDYPRYSLRLPIDVRLHDESVGHLYFSPICPVASAVNVDYAQLRMLRSEPGVCFDESDKCRQFAMEGKCTNRALHHYANHCKKSCGLCDFAPSPRSECLFPETLTGDWVMFNQREREEITLEPGIMRFSTIGSFICKSKHWEYDYYKTLTEFNNGCRPRYSCLHLTKHSTGDVMYFQMSHSTFVDESFSVCIFHDDPLPLGDMIRSKQQKILLPMTSMFLGSCGLGGMVAIQTHFADGTTCIGEMSDVNPFTCDTRSSLTLSIPNNCNYHQKEDYQCSALTTFTGTTSLLVTALRHTEETKFVCWVVDMFTDLNAPKSHLGKYQQVRCDTGLEFQIPPSPDYITSLSLNKDYDKPCSGIQDDSGGSIRNRYFEKPVLPVNSIVVGYNMSSIPKSRILRKEEEDSEQQQDKHVDTGQNMDTMDDYNGPNAHILLSSSPSVSSAIPCNKKLSTILIWIILLSVRTL